MMRSETINSQLTVIGTGLAGMAAALFAVNRGISTVQVGSSSGIMFASGFLDLLGVHPVIDGKTWKDPWKGIEDLVHDEPNHPYARLNKETISAAFDELVRCLGDAGLLYKGHKERNVEVVTAFGTVKPTYRVPESMWAGVEALERKTPCLFIDFEGMKNYGACQIAETLKTRWPGLRAARIPFPDGELAVERYAEGMAHALEMPKTRRKLTHQIRPLLKDAGVVGLPAILGLYRTKEILADLKEQIGVPVFEIPTMPPSAAGLRLKSAFESEIPKKGVVPFLQHMVSAVRHEPPDGFFLDIGRQVPVQQIQTDGIILATGRFLGKGLLAERKQIRESIFGLPVHQPQTRNGWHQPEFLDPRGHAVNRAGLTVDDEFRPIGTDGRPVYPSLYAAGSILAHQDWMRMKCGAGVAVATAYAAVNAFLKQNPPPG